VSEQNVDDEENGTQDLVLDYDFTDYVEGTVSIRHGEGSITLPVGAASALLEKAAREISEELTERSCPGRPATGSSATSTASVNACSTATSTPA